MRRVKVIIMRNYRDTYEDDFGIVGNGGTNWEDVTDEQYEKLVNHLRRMTPPASKRGLDYTSQYVLIEEASVANVLTDINDLLSEEEKRIQKMKDEELKRKKAREAKKKQTEAQKNAKELEAAKKLLEKYGVVLPTFDDAADKV